MSKLYMCSKYHAYFQGQTQRKQNIGKDKNEIHFTNNNITINKLHHYKFVMPSILKFI